MSKALLWRRGSLLALFDTDSDVLRVAGYKLQEQNQQLLFYSSQAS